MGMVVGELEDIVNGTVEFGTVRPKLSDKNVVLQFKLREEEAADSLADFVRKGPFGCVNAESQMAPNFYGAYIAFVEFQVTADLPSLLERMFLVISGLTSTDTDFFVLKTRRSEFKSTPAGIRSAVNELRSEVKGIK